MPEFQDYLNAIGRHYAQWWKLYTLMDAQGKQKQESAPLFDFGLMAQTIASKDELERGDRSSQEKVERFAVTEGLQKYATGHVLLVGRPGSGKSTALARLMLDLVKGEQIPVLVELRSYQSSILELIRSAFRRHDLNLSIADIEGLLDNSKLILLIDGVNELPSESARTDLSNFRRDHSKVPMIFTTRDLGLGGDLGIEKKLEMQPLTEKQMKVFVHAYLPGKADAMLGQLRDRLREFGTTPLLLWMLCEVFDQSPNEKLPNNLAGIFKVFTQMYEESSVRKHEVAVLKGDVRPLSDRRLWKPALKHLASVMMQGEKPIDFRVVLNRAEAEEALLEAFPNEKFPARDILDDLLKYHLLQNRTSEIIEFRHQLIQEYYAAEWLLERVGKLDDETLECNYLNYLKWTEPLALMLALVEDEALAVGVVDRALTVDLYLGAKLIGSAREIWSEKLIQSLESIKIDSYQIPQKFISNLINRYINHCSRLEDPSPLHYLNSDDKGEPSDIPPEITNHTLNSYADIPFKDEHMGHELGHNEVENILNELQSTDPKILAKVLGEIQDSCDERVLDTLIQISPRVWKTRNRYLVEKISKLLCKFPRPQTLTCLLGGINEILEINCSSEFRKAYHSNLILGLGKIGGQEAFSRLEVLLKHHNPQITCDSVTALHYVQHRDRISVLCKTLRHPDINTCLSAAHILIQIGHPESLRFIHQFHVENYENFFVKALGIDIFLMQLHFKFYNYEIYQKAIDRKPIATARDTPTQNTYEIKAEIVQIIENNYGTIAGNHNSPQEPPC